MHRRSIVGRLRSAFSTRRRRVVQAAGTERSRSGSALLLATLALLALSGTTAWASSVGFVQAHRDGQLGVDGLDGAQSIEVSPDGAYVYAGGSRDDAIAIFARNATGLTFLQIVRNGTGGVTGLNRVRALTVSPGGAHLYAAGYDDNAVAVFARNAGTGALSFVEAKVDGAGGITGLAGAHGVAVSPDGAHVYAVAAVDNAITVFSRNLATGALTLVETIVEGGLNTRLAGAESVTVSPDGAHVYVAAQGDNALSVFARNASTGRLTFVEAKVDGTGGVDGLNTCQGVSISPNGAQVYTAAAGTDNAIAVFNRNATTGALTFSQVYKDGVGGVDGLAGAEWVVVSADGTSVYAAGDTDNALVVFNRNTSTGALTVAQIHRDGVAGADGLGGAAAVVVSPDNNRVYVASTVENAVAVFATLCGNGQFDPGEQCDDGNTVNGDCCSAQCTTEAPGSPCADDGNLCTDDKCNGVGLCLHVNNTLPCDDGLFCTINDACSNRECVGAPRDCSAVGFECHPGVCNDVADQCVAPQATDGSPCDEGDACTQTDVCIAGVCVGQNPVICSPLDQCHVAGTCDPATGVCSDPLKANGSTCDDGDGCTRTDACQAGGCVGQNPVVCAQPDQCHVMGTCDPATGVCTDPAKPDGTGCDDGNACTRTDSCQAGLCVGASSVVCTAQDQCHVVGTCNPATGVCSNPEKANGTACNDGNLCTQTDACQAGVCAGANPVVCTAQDQCHVAGTCSPATGVCSNPQKANGTACNDGNLCTQTDACQAGVCAGTNPVVCAAQDQCHVAGTCSPTTGVCSNPAKADGTACNDGSLCTLTDSCATGICVGASAVVCTAQDQCHMAGVCDPATGGCSTPSKADGAGCDDGDLCTQMDVCLTGVCAGGNPVICTPQDGCHVAGVCDPATGACSNPVAADGTGCDDGNGCTQADVCLAGLCVGGNPVVCTARDQCHSVGTCNPATGVCSDPPLADGTPCDDASLCTPVDVCLGGVCAGQNPVVCPAQTPCHAPWICNPATGLCSDSVLPDGAPCDDGDGCTQTNLCLAGTCVGGDPVVCAARDQCHDVGTCDPVTGVCSDPLRANGTACDDANFCTRTDACAAGVCVGSEPVECTAQDQCHTAGTCDPMTGVCSNPAAANGTGCDDGSLCTRADVCLAGACVGGDPVVCTAEDQCNAAGICDPATGGCAIAAKPDGTACDDGDACTQIDLCLGGVCEGSDPVVCTAQDQCHDIGACDPVTGVCSNPPVADGAPCDDASVCTPMDVCLAGVCTGQDPVLCPAPSPCHEAASCDPVTGLCPDPLKPDGAACDDGDLCTQTDTCQAGACIGANPVACAAQDQCHVAGVCDPATGVCSSPAVADGTACDDGNACTQTDTCQAGVCTGASPVVCTALDQCHDAGMCDPATGVCANPEKANGTACDDEDLCTQTDTCQAGVCAGANPVECVALDQCHAVGACDPVTGMCSNPVQANGTPCSDDNLCTRADACMDGACIGSDDVICAAPDQCHDTGTCDPATGVCANPEKANGTTCDDGNLCTQTDRCAAGVCVGANSVTCAAQDQCHAAGACNPATGQCTNPPLADGTACSDSDLCTRTDACLAGVCTGQNPVVCTASDQCHAVGMCAPGTGQCSNPLKADGSACSDGNRCTQTDVCMAGVCTGQSPVVCTPLDQCHNAGTCNVVTGRCTNPARPSGSACDDSNLCTQGDACTQGVCVGQSPVVCTAQDQCHTAGVCNPFTGQCSNPQAANGTACEDGNLCTQTDRCQSGACTGGNPLICAAPDACHAAGVCNPGTGQCSNPPLTDGMACDDGDLCTRMDVCMAGTCWGQDPVTCAAEDDCHLAGACNPATGVCSNPAMLDGTPCEDGDPCTRMDVCVAGTCVGAGPVVCVAQDACHFAGVCDPMTGACANPPVGDGRPCDDGNACTLTDACQAGVCVGAGPLICAAEDECHAAGVCDPATGRCSNPAVANGTACDDGSLCTRSDACMAGVCRGQDVVCTPRDECHATGVCDPATGQCSNPLLADGTACDDGNACTLTDGCQAGVCVGMNPVVCTAQDQCHVSGVCDPATGACSNPPLVDGTVCDDASLCTVADVCVAGRCVGQPSVTCAAQDQCHVAGVCDPATGACSNPALADGTACDDGSACTRADACQAGVCVGADPVMCAAQDQCHVAGVCDAATGRCSNPAVADGTACDDRSLCTRNDACVGGACVGAPAVICTAQDQCHTAGVCDAATGQCSNPALADGTSCDDGSACTRADKCQAGVCVGADPVTCAAQDQCHVAGVCNPATGTCSNPAAADGAACDDGAYCTVGDVCRSGACAGRARHCDGATVQCIEAVCDEATDACVVRLKPDKALCNDGDQCTQVDVCLGGSCVGQSRVVCTAADACHVAGVCNSATGECSSPSAADGTRCDDGDACSGDDSCAAGVCAGEPLADQDADGFCDPIDVCPEIADPAQLDADGDGVGDLCQCTAPAPGRCIAGGGSTRTDCLVEFLSAGGLSLDGRGMKVKPILRCADGDPACDLDGARDGTCTFGVSMCFANSDPRLSRCTPERVRSMEVLQPKADRGKSVMDLANAAALETAASALGLEVRRNGRIIAPSIAFSSNDHCTPLIELHTPAPAGGKPVRRGFVLRGRGINGRSDKDSFVTLCE